MAITPTAQQTAVLASVAAMFGAACGATNLNVILPAVTTADPYGTAVKALAATDLWKTSMGYGSLDTTQTYQKFLLSLAGSLVSSADQAAVVTLMVNNTGTGKLFATVQDGLAAIIKGLPTLTADATWGRAAQQFVNKVDVSGYYTLDKSMNATTLADLQKVLAGVNYDAASVTYAKQIMDSATLTVYPDRLTGSIFEAPQAYVPGGNDLINTLQNDDVLLGTESGTDTLNATLGNNNDNGGTVITPTMTGVEIINGKFDATNASMTLDLQDSTGVTTINMSRVAEGRDATVQNIADSTATTLSVNNSFSPANSVHFTYLASALSANNNTAALTLNNVNTAQLRIEERGAAPTQGFETINMASSGSANTLALFTAEDLQTLNVTGSQNLTINNFSNVSGSFVTLNAGAATGNMTLNMYDNVSNRNILTAAPDGTSSGSVPFALTTGIGADTVIINTDAVSLTGIEANDSVDLGTGTDTLRLQSNNNNSDFITTNATAQVAGVEAVQVFHTAAIVGGASGANVMAVRAGQMTGDQTFLLTDRVTTAATNAIRSTYNLVDLSAAEATAITINHSGNPNAAPGAANNGLRENMVDLDVATGVAAATVNIGEGVNTDPRFNFYLYTDSDRALSTVAGNTMNFASAQNTGTVNAVTTLTLNDTDTESNSVGLIAAGYNTAGVAQGAGSSYSTVNLTTGRAGTFLNLDVAAAAGGGASNGGVYGYDITGFAAGDVNYLADHSATANQVKLQAAVVNASAFAGNAVVRVSTNFNSVVGAQSITMGTGNDTVIFDNNADTRAGLTISDTVAGGTGSDVLMIDGNGVRISLGASEWTNVTGFETLRLVGNGQADANGRGAVNAYNLTITNELVDANAADGNRIAIVNDNGANAAMAANNGVTIDGRGLSSTNNYSYDGQETTAGVSAMTADRFIFADGNINGNSLIDGGADTTTAGGNGGTAAGHQRNGDVLEVRNAAVVTTGDLAGFSNVGTIEFTNDTAAIQTSILQLNNAVVDAMVNSTAAADGSNATTIAASFENMIISAIDNPLLPAAVTQLNIDTAGLTNAALRLTINGGGGADTINGGAGNDSITAGAGADTLTDGAGLDTVIGGTGADAITMTADGIVDVIQQATGDSVAYTAATLSATFTATDTITFGSSLDIVTGFVAGAGGDTLDLGGPAATAPTTGIGVATNLATTATNYFLSGNYAGGVFTVTADGLGADTLIGDATDASGLAAASTSWILLSGVNSAALAAGNFV